MGKIRIYYGWIIVGVAALLQFAGGTPTFPVLGLFMEPMTEDMGWSRVAFATPMTIGTILGGIAGIIIGPAIDKYGARWIMTVASLVLGLAFVAMSFIDHYWQHFLLQMIIRSLTAGTFFMIVGIIVPKWFITMRGRAMAISSMGGRLGQFLTPIVIGWIIIQFGWRAGWSVMGSIVWVVSVAPVFFLLKNTPEDMGLLPDGKSLSKSENSNINDSTKDLAEELSIGPRQALRTRSFYLMLIAQSGLSLVISGLHFHWFAYMTGQGIAESAAIASISISAITGVPISLAAGFLGERVPLRYVFVATYLGFSVSILILLSTTTPLMAYLYGISLGICSGITFTLNQLIWADYYGRKSLGAIRGLTSPINQVTNASGPVVAAVAFDMTGDYTAILWVFAITTSLASMLWFVATPPKLPSSDHLISVK